MTTESESSSIDQSSYEEEDESVAVLWEGGGIEIFETEDDAKHEMMAMAGRGLTGQIYADKEEAEAALKAYAEAYKRQHEDHV